MPRKERAKQFAPFDALKGLQDALKIKQYEHERILKNDIPEEKAQEISNILRNLTKNDILEITYYCDGHNLTAKDKAKLDIENQLLEVGTLKIPLDNIYDLKKIGS